MQPLYITQTKNALIVAIIALVVFGTMLSGLLFMDGLATWWFLLIIVAMGIAFYLISLYTFVRMEFYDEAIYVRHMLKPRQAQRIQWEEIVQIDYRHTSSHPHRVVVTMKGRKTPFVFSLMHEEEAVRTRVLDAFREKGVKVNLAE